MINKSDKKFLEDLKAKSDVGIALDYLNGCRIQGLQESVIVRLRNGSHGLHEAFKRLLELGREVLCRVEKIFQCMFELYDNCGPEIAIQPVVA